MAVSDPDPQSLLPLTPAVFHILLALSGGDRHGYAIAQEITDATAGRIRMGPGTLYGTLTRMLAAGLVLEPAGKGARGAGPDERRRYYRITPFGRRVAKAEAARLAALVDLARDKAVLSPGR